jgi:hypothetical protein
MFVGGISVAALLAFVAVIGHTHYRFLDHMEKLHLTHDDLAKLDVLRSFDHAEYQSYYSSDPASKVSDTVRAELDKSWEEKIDGDFMQSDVREIKVLEIDPDLADALHKSTNGSLVVVRTPDEPIRDGMDSILDSLGL